MSERCAHGHPTPHDMYDQKPNGASEFMGRCPGPRPRPDQLWRQADEEFPNDQAARRIRYVALMREHGLLRPTLPGEPRNLPCGWPNDPEVTR